MVAVLVIWLVGFLLAVNLVTFAAFAVDKRAAARDNQRISEDTLLKLALLGGSPGAKLAQARLRHKSVKQPFGRRLNLIIGLQVLLLAAGVSLYLSPGSRAVIFSQFPVLLE